MLLARCDNCCDVLDGIADGIVYECDSKVEGRLGFEHLCKDCLESSNELYLESIGTHFNLIHLIEED